MAIGGPRLDRPSVVGDEGRPRATSVTIAAVVVVVLSTLVLWQISRLGELTFLGLACMLQVGGLALLTRDRIGPLTVGHLLYHGGAVALLLLLILAPAGHPLVYLGVFLALFGVAATWSNVLVRDELETASKRAPISYVALLGWLAVGIVLFGFGLAIYDALVWTSLRTAPYETLTGFLLAVAAAGTSVYLAVRVLPIVELTPVDQRPTRRSRVRRVRRTAAAVGAVTFALLLVVWQTGQETIQQFAVANPGIERAIYAIASAPVLGAIALVATLAAAAAIAGFLLRRAAMGIEAGKHGLVAGLLAGFIFAVFVLPLFAVAPVVVGLSLVASPLAFVLGFVGVAAMTSGQVSDRAAAPTLAAVGLVLTAIGAGLGAVPTPLVLALVAGAIVVWDLCTFGLGLTVELGHRPETRRLELYHGILSLGVGLVAVLGLTGLDAVRQSFGSQIGAWPAVGIAVAGAILLALASRVQRA